MFCAYGCILSVLLGLLYLGYISVYLSFLKLFQKGEAKYQPLWDREKNKTESSTYFAISADL